MIESKVRAYPLMPLSKKNGQAFFTSCQELDGKYLCDFLAVRRKTGTGICILLLHRPPIIQVQFYLKAYVRYGFLNRHTRFIGHINDHLSE